MVKHVLMGFVAVVFLAACGVPDSELSMTDDLQGEAELMEEGQELASSAAKSWFPLNAGNEWVFENATGTRTLKVEAVGTGIARVTGLHAEGKWLGVAAGSPNTLYAWDGDAGNWNVFIRFGYAKTAWSYAQSDSPCQTFAAKRSATGQSYTTAAGTFKDTRSMSFTLTPPPNVRCAQPDFSELVFAAKTGPVFIRLPDGTKLGLKSAKVGTATFPKSTVSGAVTVTTKADKVSYINYENTIRCVTAPCPSNGVNAEAHVTTTLTNNTTQTHTFQFTSGCQTNIEVVDAAGTVVKNVGSDRMCAMVVFDVPLAPGATKTWTETVPLIADSGEQLNGTYTFRSTVHASAETWSGSMTATKSFSVSVQ